MTFVRGHTYVRQEELHGEYGRQKYGGISTPVEHPMAFLFTGEAGVQYGYRGGVSPPTQFAQPR